MLTKLKQLKRNFFQKLIGLFSLSAVLFVFEACYGPPQDYGLTDVEIHGTVRSENNNEAVPNVRVFLDNIDNGVLTNENGEYWIYAVEADKYRLVFKDTDEQLNGKYRDKDTIVEYDSTQRILEVDVFLSE